MLCLLSLSLHFSISILLLQLLHQSLYAPIESEINKAQPTQRRRRLLPLHSYTRQSTLLCVCESTRILSQSAVGWANSKLLRNRIRNITVDSKSTRNVQTQAHVSLCVCVCVCNTKWKLKKKWSKKQSKQNVLNTCTARRKEKEEEQLK